ncbi:peptide ABC transporter substrate-binding protein [Brevibacillus invocatus]|uniref:Peptide ABC transporter substrate-binding protein n=2 Tax=Brevibacillus invocatus TaxID=173959 RepID=A0A3M8BZ43_9BACL|nr:peptide ABC transporter substrate-binding protein [Brevibacillus invocatus]
MVFHIFLIVTILLPKAPVQAVEMKASASDEHILRLAVMSDPITLDPSVAEDTTSVAFIQALFDGLTRIGKDGKAHESMAEKIEVSDDLVTYTFHLRNAKWSNGDPVTAHDFEYAWKQVIDPENAASYAYQMFPIKNAEKAQWGEASLNEVGVKALNDKTLQVTLEHPTPYFLELTSFYSYYPVNKKLANSNPNWAQNVNTHVGNGPFKLTMWERGDRIKLIKNDNYWDKNSVRLDGIDFSIIRDGDQEFSKFLKGELDWAGSPLGNIPANAVPKLIEHRLLYVKPIAGVYWYKFNTEQPPFQNAKIRKAFAYALDRQTLFENVSMYHIAALGVVPPSMKVKEMHYLKDNDVETAKKLLAEGMMEMGIKSLPHITLSINSGEGHEVIAREVLRQWKESLGVDVKLEVKEWQVHLEDMHDGNYQLGRMGWLADFNDPINFLELFKYKDGGTNDTRWENSKYIELLNQSSMEKDPIKREKIMEQAEQILMDEMPVMPIYYYINSWVKREYVQDVVIDGLGSVDYKWASITE